MTANLTQLSPVTQAEEALQVVGVLTRMERRFETGRWEHGFRVGPTGGNCLIGAIDEASSWTQPGVEEAVTRQLTARLPRVLRPLARIRPRMALALYNDAIGREAAVRLVRRTRFELGGRGPATDRTGSSTGRVTIGWSSDGNTHVGVSSQPVSDLPAASARNR